MFVRLSGPRSRRTGSHVKKKIFDFSFSDFSDSPAPGALSPVSFIQVVAFFAPSGRNLAPSAFDCSWGRGFQVWRDVKRSCSPFTPGNAVAEDRDPRPGGSSSFSVLGQVLLKPSPKSPFLREFGNVECGVCFFSSLPSLPGIIIKMIIIRCSNFGKIASYSARGLGTFHVLGQFWKGAVRKLSLGSWSKRCWNAANHRALENRSVLCTL